MRRRSLILVSVLAAVTAIAAVVAIQRGQNASSPALVYAESATFSGLPSTIWRAAADGTHKHELAAGSSPQLSPDGKLVAFTRWSESPRTSDILVVPRVGGTPVLLEHLFGDRIWTNNVPVWAPDSGHLLAVEQAGVVVLDAKTHTRRVLLPGRRNVGIETLSFSPNSRFFAYGTDDRTGGDIYLEAISGGKPHRITHDHKSFMPLWGTHGIAYNRGGFAHGDIWIISPNGNSDRQLTRTNAGIYPAFFSADASHLLAANPAVHNGRLWAIDTTNGRAQNVTGWRGDLFPQGLSRDGTTILAAIGCGGMASSFGIVETLPFSGGNPTVIARGPCRASWNR